MKTIENTIYLNGIFIPYNIINVQKDVIYFLINKEYLEKFLYLHIKSSNILFHRGYTYKDDSLPIFTRRSNNKYLHQAWWEIDLESITYNEDLYNKPEFFELKISGEWKIIDNKILIRNYFIDEIING